MKIGDWQTIHFPFEVTAVRCELSQFSRAVPANSVLFCLRASERLQGIHWTDKFESNFRYLPEVAGDDGEMIEFELTSGTKWTSAQVSLQPWGAGASNVAQLASRVTLTAAGVLGEERREYSVAYQWEIAPEEFSVRGVSDRA